MLFSVSRAVHKSGTWLDSHEAQFRGKSDVDDNVDRPEALRFFGAYLLTVAGVDMRNTFQMKRKATRGQYEKVL